MEQARQLLFYPLYGACILESVEQQTDKVGEGSGDQVFHLYFPKQELRMMIPKQRAQERGIRPLSDVDTLLQARAEFFGNHVELPLDASKRREHLQARIDTGLLREYFGVIRDLLCAKVYALKLNTHDRSTMNTARDMLISELTLVLNFSAEDASAYLKQDIEKRQQEADSFDYFTG